MLVQKLNMRLGDEFVAERSESSLDEDYEPYENPVNTREYQIDNQLVPKFFYITDVIKTIIFHIQCLDKYQFQEILTDLFFYFFFPKIRVEEIDTIWMVS